MTLNGYLFDQVLFELVDIVGREHVLTADTDRLPYGADFYWLAEMWLARGGEPLLPDFVVMPGTTEEVARVVKLANRHRLPIVPWGGGSGSQGGALAVYGGIVLDVKRLDRLVEVDEVSLTMAAGAGINGQLLEEQLNARGLSLPHYPASVYWATLGGYLAARGSGVLSTKYGKAEDMVVAIEAVTPTGEVIRTLPVPSHATGPGLLSLFVGSEGTLGVITEATMRIIRQPAVRRFRTWLLQDTTVGLEVGRRIMHAGLRPCVIRLYDETATAKTVKSVLGIEAKGAYLVLGFDGDAESVDLEERRAFAICREAGAKDLGPEGGEHWWAHRYDFYFPPYVKQPPKLYGTVETVCRYRDIERLYRAKKAKLETTYADWKLVYTAHFSHWYPWGVMVYDVFTIDAPPADRREAILLHNRIWADAARTSLAHGGVLNEHHGIGLKLGWLMPEQYGPAWPTMERIKTALDPRNVMNPGKLGLPAFK